MNLSHIGRSGQLNLVITSPLYLLNSLTNRDVTQQSELAVVEGCVESSCAVEGAYGRSDPQKALIEHVNIGQLASSLVFFDREFVERHCAFQVCREPWKFKAMSNM